MIGYDMQCLSCAQKLTVFLQNMNQMKNEAYPVSDKPDPYDIPE